MKKKTTIITFVFTLFSMLYFMYGIWVIGECVKEINSLVAGEMVNLKTDLFKVVSYIFFDKGLASVVFYCLALFGFGQLFKGEESAEKEQETPQS